jgi:serine/threonine protein kinase
VSELAANGEAFDYVSDAGGLKPAQARCLFKQLCAGVNHLHEKGIAHRDLKLENCFLDKNVILKVADFGLSKVFSGEESLMTRCGTESYMSPEIKEG